MRRTSDNANNGGGQVVNMSVFGSQGHRFDTHHTLNLRFWGPPDVP